MRTNIVIDDALMQLNQQAQFHKFRGKLRWEGSLDLQRLDAPQPDQNSQR
ncbi:hypothetical protein KBY58_04300 [Cyanobium sp. HWJ4-Hawea]|nr:hypothetical protein [Cyanobium sp. HWJ4-Hawea]MCP9808651.1 hypothetical protein [Cyanobium sp. HWJ4-Hawea]